MLKCLAINDLPRTRKRILGQLKDEKSLHVGVCKLHAELHAICSNDRKGANVLNIEV